jgi:hypothetical protein
LKKPVEETEISSENRIAFLEAEQFILTAKTLALTEALRDLVREFVPIGMNSRTAAQEDTLQNVEKILATFDEPNET